MIYKNKTIYRQPLKKLLDVNHLSSYLCKKYIKNKTCQQIFNNICTNLKFNNSIYY